VVNDRHPSGNSFPADTSPDFSFATHDGGPYEQAAFDIYAQQGAPQGGHTGAYDGYSTGGYDNYATSYGDGDPLFGSMPGADTGTGSGSYATGTYDAYAGNGAYDTYDTGGYDTGTTWANAQFPQTADVQAQQGQQTHGQADYGYGTGQWDAAQWSTGQWGSAQWDSGQWDSGQWDSGQWDSPAEGGSWDIAQPETPGLDPQADPYSAAMYDGYAYGYDDAAQGVESHEYGVESHEYYESHDRHEPEAAEGYGAYEQHPSYEQPVAHDVEPDATAAFAAFDGYHHVDAEPGPYGSHDAGHHPGHYDAPDADHEFAHGTGTPPGPDVVAVGAAPHLRGRRRSVRPRRSAMLSVAVPSVAVMGVAGAAAASVVDTGPDDRTTTQASAPDTAGVKPANSKLDTQLAGLSADADDFADRASRTQERIDLKERQEAERERKEKAAARKEALRPKFALPVKEHGLSAQYGQAGLNWMSVHTGIDFPVSEGTPVMAATDGTVTTKYDMSFGNMAVVTSPDGTETWYCHLSSTKIRSGPVKAGDTIGYSGSSGNSTGPHLHFEVHPGGGEAIDPLPWLRAKGLEPN